MEMVNIHVKLSYFTNFGKVLLLLAWIEPKTDCILCEIPGSRQGHMLPCVKPSKIMTSIYG